MLAAPLISDRIPFVLLERCKIMVDGRHVIAKNKNGTTNIPIRNIQLLIIGNGSSITSDVMYLCAKNRCYIAQSKGGLNIHSTLHAGLYQNPTRIQKQVCLSLSKKRIEIAKYIAIKKLKTLPVPHDEYMSKINQSDQIDQILGYEGAFTKKANKFIFGESFKRQFGKSDCSINKNMNITNSIIYNFIGATVCALGFHPSIGFLHGHTRRGGLVFDVADMVKYDIYKTIDFHFNHDNLIRKISNVFMANNKYVVRNIIKEIEHVCGWQQ